MLGRKNRSLARGGTRSTRRAIRTSTINHPAVPVRLVFSIHFTLALTYHEVPVSANVSANGIGYPGLNILNSCLVLAYILVRSPS